MPFQPGNKLATGRPKNLGYVQELAKKQTEKAIATLTEIMTSDGVEPAVRVSAAEKLLNRGWGTPVQAVELTGEDQGPIKIEVSFPCLELKK